jgi:alkylation response protein AidB-like acyl-CoA dehydrogenase
VVPAGRHRGDRARRQRRPDGQPVLAQHRPAADRGARQPGAAAAHRAGGAAGEKIAALAITEPGGGSDVARLRTTARRDGEEWVIDGEKTFITSGMRADWITLAVRTGGPGAGGISLLVVPGDAPG